MTEKERQALKDLAARKISHESIKSDFPQFDLAFIKREVFDALNDNRTDDFELVYQLVSPHTAIYLDVFNWLLLYKNHRYHQEITMSLQHIKSPSSVPFIREILNSNFDYLQYTYSESGVIAKWFSHALHAIHTEEAIAVIHAFATHPDRGIRDEMRYRLIRGEHVTQLAFKKISLPTTAYKTYGENLPKAGNHLIGHVSDQVMTVYTAVNYQTAAYAASRQKLGGADFSLERMLWIMPGFLPMMRATEWASKPGQERILAIQLHLDHFHELLSNVAYSFFDPTIYRSVEAWKQDLLEKENRVQWEPDRNEYESKIERQVMRLGLQGKSLQAFNDDMILSVEDITDFVEAQGVYRHVVDPYGRFEVIQESVINL